MNVTNSAESRTQELSAWIENWLRKELRLRAGQLEQDKTFVGFGMDSVLATMLAGDLEELLGRRLPPTLAWDFPTIGALAAHLAQLPDAAPLQARSSDAELLEKLDDLSDEEIERLLAERLGNN
jgi:acyl carrier protein